MNLLGGRNKVIEACKLDQSEDGRRRLYIIDADFDHVFARPKPRLRHLYRIRAYCIENVLLHPRSVAEICCDCQPAAVPGNVDQIIDYQGLIGRWERPLRSLFILYALAQEFNIGIRTVRLSIFQLLSRVRGSWQFDPSKLYLRMMQIARATVRVVGLAAFVTRRRQLQTQAERLSFDQVVSGKDCILPVVFTRVRSRFGYRGSQEQFKVLLAKEFRRECEPWLFKRVQKIAS